MCFRRYTHVNVSSTCQFRSRSLSIWWARFSHLSKLRSNVTCPRKRCPQPLDVHRQRLTQPAALHAHLIHCNTTPLQKSHLRCVALQPFRIARR
uniref:Uncharacterized protein n=1 Tax=Parascaris univalens TaxID=6257 RepID=A0A915C9W7_PARUN